MRRRTFLGLAGIGAVAVSVGDGTLYTNAKSHADVGPLGELALSGNSVMAAEPPGGALPFMHGYDAPAIKSWSPAVDSYAKYLRSRVPIAPRVRTFEPTQAHPELSDLPQMATLSNDYHEAENYQLGYKYGNSFEAYALRYWQYLDMYGSWHGLPVDGEYGKPSPRFGVVNLPNPAWTDAAHRNGVRSLGCWFWPRPEDFSSYVEKRADGSFPLADKLIEMAEYFGFDGYFINQEATITAAQAALLREMLGYLNRKAPDAFHLQWYDSLTVGGQVSYENEFTSRNSPWISTDTQDGSDSIFLNYAWSDARLRRSSTYARTLGLDPYEVVYAGTENQKYNFSPPYDPRYIFPTAKPARTSWSVFGADMVWARVSGEKKTVEQQKPCYLNERLYWCGPKQDPSRSGRSLTPDGADKGNPERWDGVAHYIVEKSVIGGYPFVTRFNTGTGERFFVDMSESSAQPWFNIASQDILPTWQWWVRHADNSPAPEITLDYDYTAAVDGPACLAVKGSLTAGRAVEARLFKTRLLVESDVRLSLTYATDQAPNNASNLRVGLTFEEAPATVTWLEAGDATRPGWNVKQFSLGSYAGRRIAAISLGFLSGQAISSYTVRIGELRLERTGGPIDVPPAQPGGFRIEAKDADSAEADLFLSWDFDRSLWYYDVMRVLPDGKRQWLGRTYDEVFVVAGLTRIGGEAVTSVELVPVSSHGVRGAPARTALTWPT